MLKLNTTQSDTETTMQCYTRLPLHYSGLFKIGSMLVEHTNANPIRNFYHSTVATGLGRHWLVNVLIGWPKSITALEHGAFCHLDGEMLPGTSPKDVVLLPRIKSVVQLCHSSWIPATVENVISVHGRGQVVHRKLRCNILTDEMELMITVMHREWDPLVGNPLHQSSSALTVCVCAGAGIRGIRDSVRGGQAQRYKQPPGLGLRAIVRIAIFGMAHIPVVSLSCTRTVTVASVIDGERILNVGSVSRIVHPVSETMSMMVMLDGGTTYFGVLSAVQIIRWQLVTWCLAVEFMDSRSSRSRMVVTTRMSHG
ncbi:uncharacterized protein MELLADRAFT_107157 [Melampsora larici-populina 98AG31]|uniref:Uncharacterized protein n=1 Tax=Melampsora larici-populina (strain 98AG31 / pathotype 3-4-7) TaxID=747676 RepID=F4RP14_MELLP|nr:uncharacterized protein MELLADRAFT_107157 [Melampsora larici-populina 98AG31]EGG05934.1 hypothetical protein MELLADRAFT_107157 [Melampsora larici-populina 98AG31]